MRTMWILAALAATFLLGVDAAADTVYLKDGRSFWGREAYEEGSFVVLVRPDGTLRFPKDEVSRVQPTQTTLPRFYTPPGSSVEAPGAPRTPAGAAGPPAAGTPPGGVAPTAGVPPAQPQASTPPGGSSPAGPPGPPAAPPPPPPPSTPSGGGTVR